MVEEPLPMHIVINRLKEREKELNCIYHVEELLSDYSRPIEEVLISLLEVIPMGWQYPGVCKVMISYENMIVQSEGFAETEWMQQADLIIDNNVSGSIKISYTSLIRLFNNSQFLAEEQKLLLLIAERVSASIFHRKLKATVDFLKAYTDPEKIPGSINSVLKATSDMHWKWRLRMAVSLAEKLNLKKFSITGIYLIGNTKDATSGPGSDLDLLIHFHGNKRKKQLLVTWIEGWSFGLAEFNFAQTGYLLDSLIDLHFITDDDFKHPNSYSEMIYSPDRPAWLLKGSKPSTI
jgi:hypothetical protein